MPYFRGFVKLAKCRYIPTYNRSNGQSSLLLSIALLICVTAYYDKQPDTPLTAPGTISSSLPRNLMNPPAESIIAMQRRSTEHYHFSARQRWHVPQCHVHTCHVLAAWCSPQRSRWGELNRAAPFRAAAKVLTPCWGGWRKSSNWKGISVWLRLGTRDSDAGQTAHCVTIKYMYKF